MDALQWELLERCHSDGRRQCGTLRIDHAFIDLYAAAWESQQKGFVSLLRAALFPQLLSMSESVFLCLALRECFHGTCH